jgi:hypothetical protein
MNESRCNTCGHGLIDHHGPGGYCRAVDGTLECKCHHFSLLPPESPYTQPTGGQA